MKLNNEQYDRLIRERMPKSPLGRDLLKAFGIGGLICCVGQGVRDAYAALGAEPEAAAGWTTVTMIFLGVLLTGLGVYDRIAKHGGAGTLVPITGFANAVSAPAMEFRTEGYITGTAVKMFTIAGPVIVYGILSSVLYGIALMLLR